MVTTGAATQLKNLHRLWPGGAGDIRQHGEPAAADLSLRALQPWWRSSSPSSLSCRATTRSWRPGSSTVSGAGGGVEQQTEEGSHLREQENLMSSPSVGGIGVSIFRFLLQLIRWQKYNLFLSFSVLSPPTWPRFGSGWYRTSSVLIAACDTFSAGSVEQLRTRTRWPNSLNPSQLARMVLLCWKGQSQDTRNWL